MGVEIERALNDLIPLVYIAAIVMVGVGLIGMGGAGYVGMGPLGRRNAQPLVHPAGCAASQLPHNASASRFYLSRGNLCSLFVVQTNDLRSRLLELRIHFIWLPMSSESSPPPINSVTMNGWPSWSLRSNTDTM